MMFSPFGFGFYSPFYLNGGGFIMAAETMGVGATDQETVSADEVVVLVVGQELGWAAVASTAEEASTAAVAAMEAAVTALVVDTGRLVKPSTVSRADR